MKLHQLVSDIKKDQKIPTEELLMILTTAITDNKDECELSKHLYHKAYGDSLSEEMCKKWVASIYADEPKWTVSQTSSVGESIGVSWNKLSKYEFWACMNAFYSDFYKLAKKYGHDEDAEYFAEYTWEFFDDEDAHDKTPANYYLSFVD